MADEKTKGSGTATVDSPGENTVQLTFLPEGKTVEFEHDKLPRRRATSHAWFAQPARKKLVEPWRAPAVRGRAAGFRRFGCRVSSKVGDCSSLKLRTSSSGNRIRLNHR